jgi:hypothetical protein
MAHIAHRRIGLSLVCYFARSINVRLAAQEWFVSCSLAQMTFRNSNPPLRLWKVPLLQKDTLTVTKRVCVPLLA